MKKILSLVLILMLLSMSLSPVLATAGIEDDCRQYFTADDMKRYISNHAYAGHTDHTAMVDRMRNDFDPAKECHDASHSHHQSAPTIVVKDICRVHYECTDHYTFPAHWKVTIEEKIGRERGLYWDDETLWNDAVPSPCATYEHTFSYDLHHISNEDLLQLFSCICSVDQYLDHTTDSKIINDLAADFFGGTVGIASTLVSIAKCGGKIPYIGEIILIGVGAASAIYTLIAVNDEIHKIDVMRDQVFKAVATTIKMNS